MSHNGAGPQALEADIARQREELAATVDELQYRLDVPARAKERPLLLGGIAVATATIIGLVIWRKSKS